MMGLPAGTRIWLAASVTDMRSGMNGLAAKVQMTLLEDPLAGHVFVFRGKRGNLVKVLWATSDGGVPVDQAPGTRPVCLAAGECWQSPSDPGTAIHAARRNQLEAAGTHLTTTGALVNGPEPA